MKILNFGSLNVDRVYSVHDFVQAGETILATGLDFFPGGKGLNQTIAVAKAGGNVYHVGIIGRDGKILKECLQENRVALDFLREMPDQDGGHTALQVNENGQNAIIVYPGTNAMIDRDFVDTVMEQIEPGDYVLMQNEISNVPYIIREAKKAGAVVAINPSPVTRELFSAPLELCDIMIVNELEGGALTGETDTEKILDALIDKFPDARIILTLGCDGSWYGNRKERIFQPIYQAVTVDTTAAGDTYCGYLLACLSRGEGAAQALQKASAAAAIAVSRRGAATSIPSFDEVEAFLVQQNAGKE